MTWGAVAGSAISVVGGSLLGGSKEGQRDAQDAAFRGNLALSDASANATAATRPFVETGTEANKLLSQYLGIDTSGYGQRPTREDAAIKYAKIHSDWSGGKDYKRNSSKATIDYWTDRIYKEDLAAWEKGLDEYKKNNADAMGDGRLLKDFTNEDFVKDPGYEARLAEGEKGANRTFAARGSLASGSALKALERYRQDYASNEFGNAYNRDAANKSRTYGFLSNTAGQGLNAAGTAAGFAQNAAINGANLNANATNQVNQMQTNREDNQSNLFQSALGNLIYGMERNKPVVSNRTVTSSDSQKPWYYSG